MTQTDERKQYLENLYGQCYTGDYEVTTVVTFRDADRHEHTSAIAWVAGPGEIGTLSVPLRYIMEEIDPETGDMFEVATGDIFEVIETPEPAMKLCPYCAGYHMARSMNLCPLKARL